MKLLALDTATRGCSAAVWSDGVVVARRFEEMARGQSEALMPMVTAVMAEAGQGFAALDLVAATVGPGAFTGLRIGLAAARGMALALAVPCFGVTTLEAVAEGVPAAERESRNVLVALDAKRADVYVQLFSPALEPLSRPEARLPEDLSQLVTADAVIAGDAAEPVVEALRAVGIDACASSAPGIADAVRVAEIAARRWRPGVTTGMPEPLYLRPPDVTISANSGQLRP